MNSISESVESFISITSTGGFEFFVGLAFSCDFTGFFRVPSVGETVRGMLLEKIEDSGARGFLGRIGETGSVEGV